MDPRKGTARPMSDPSQLRRLRKVPKSSPKFERDLVAFLGNAERESVVDNLHDADLEEFVDFLDEVRCSTHPRVIVVTILSGTAV